MQGILRLLGIAPRSRLADAVLERGAGRRAEDVRARVRDWDPRERVLVVRELHRVGRRAELAFVKIPSRRAVPPSGLAVGWIVYVTRGPEAEAPEGRQLAVAREVLAPRAERGVAARVVVAPEDGAPICW